MADDGTGLEKDLKKVKNIFLGELVKETGVVADILVENTKKVIPEGEAALRSSIIRKKPVTRGKRVTCSYGTEFKYAKNQNNGKISRNGTFAHGSHYLEQGILNSKYQIEEELETWLDKMLKEL